eukprot:COSAG01_NODE_71009_length_257_cov_0.651899_1_plen_27_part_10
MNGVRRDKIKLATDIGMGLDEVRHQLY